MMSVRNIADATDAKVLDAARDCVLHVGVRRTTLTDVARRAGVSRMTVYRRWPDVRVLVGDLMTREWTALATGILHGQDREAGARDRVVEGSVAVSKQLRAHPLFRKVVDVDPELLLPYVLDRRGASQDVMLEVLEGVIREGQRDDTIRAGNVKALAASVLLTVQSFTLSAHTMADRRGCSQSALDRELRHLLEGYLTP